MKDKLNSTTRILNPYDLALTNDSMELIAEFMNLDNEEKMIILDESIAALRQMVVKTPKEKRLISKLVSMRNLLL